MKKTGFYIIKDKFFEDIPDPYLKENKAGNRPHYYCFKDEGCHIIYHRFLKEDYEDFGF